MSAMKTPGVYVLEKNAFPNSVVEVATAVPAFIGYTEVAKNGTKSLLNVPWKISSLAEFEQYFGKAPKPKFELEKADDTSLGVLSLKDLTKITEITKLANQIQEVLFAMENAENASNKAQSATLAKDINTNVEKSIVYISKVTTVGEEYKTEIEKNSITKFDEAKVLVKSAANDDATKSAALTAIKTAAEAIKKSADNTADQVVINKIAIKIAAINGMKADQFEDAFSLLEDALEILNNAKILGVSERAQKEKDQTTSDLGAAKSAAEKAEKEGAVDEDKNKSEAALKNVKTALQKAIVTAKVLSSEIAAINTLHIEDKSNAFETTEDATQMQFYSLKRKDSYNLYYHLRFFFANGGGPCYIVSVGEGYKEDAFSYGNLLSGIEPLLKEQEPTMLLIPEAVYLGAQECYDLQQAAIKHCGDMRNRITILDIYNGDKSRKDAEVGDVVGFFREKIGTEFLDYATAYYPWLNSSIVSEKDVSVSVLSKIEDLKTILETEAVFQKDGKRILQLLTLVEGLTDENLKNLSAENELHKILLKQSAVYATIMKEIVEKINLLPPSAAMAGIYTLVDNAKEVWKAPANIGVSNTISTAVNVSHADQEDLNVPLNGKAVNAIRYFVGEGIKVWGARTLDGNSLDWRYINVRRTMIMLEESIKNATKAFVFEPNTANTWVSVSSMINNFLNGIWKRGGLAGSSPNDAFSVHIGLGDTMTPEDILEGIMRITVLVAIVRPAEFIEITFQQQMQKS